MKLKTDKVRVTSKFYCKHQYFPLCSQPQRLWFMFFYLLGGGGGGGGGGGDWRLLERRYYKSFYGSTLLTFETVMH